MMARSAQSLPLATDASPVGSEPYSRSLINGLQAFVLI